VAILLITELNPMKHILNFVSHLIFIGLLLTSCKKDPVTAVANRAPVARAGADESISLPSCSSRTGAIALDGSSSFDPDGNIVRFSWKEVTGPSGSQTLTNSTSRKASVKNLSPGQYAFELTVTDAGGLASRDTMAITVVGLPTAYNLDVTFNSYFTFQDNFQDCGWDYDVNPSCSYYDWTEIEGKGNFQPVGQFNMHVFESEDTAALSDVVQSQSFDIYTGTGSTESLWGTSTINFKKLIRDGGGGFDGTIKIMGGSAKACAYNVFDNLTPLTVSGNLNITTHAVTLRISGKVYF